MGGSALGQQMPRLSRKTYFRIVCQLKARLCPSFYEFVQEPRCFDSKLSFGDVDLLVSRKSRHFNPQNELSSRNVVRNGPIKSFDFEGYQVDLIEIAADCIDLSRFFFGYSDMGMIFGMFMRNIGLKFGMRGLTLKLETYKIHLSNDIRLILSFLKLDFDAWQAGFKTQDALFEFITGSKYFQRSFFARSERVLMDDKAKRVRSENNGTFEQPTIWNHECRSRFNERPMFKAFIQFVEAMPEMEEQIIHRGDIRDQALTYFDKQAEYAEIEKHLALVRKVKQKFNGDIAMQLSGLCGKTLGNCMASFKHKYPLNVLDDMNPEDIEKLFIQHSKVFLQENQE